jgi:hypothetical protein
MMVMAPVIGDDDVGDDDGDDVGDDVGDGDDEPLRR